MGVEYLVFMIPIIGIVGGIGSGMLSSHYKHKEKMMGHMSVDQMAELERMSKIADILDQRVNVLERILDDEVPTWRESQETQQQGESIGRGQNKRESYDKTI